MPSTDQVAPAAPAVVAVSPGTVMFYQVFVPSPVLGAGGVPQLAMHGPFALYPEAAAFAAKQRGSFVGAMLVLHEGAAPMSIPHMRAAAQG